MSNETSNVVLLKTYDAPHLAHLDEAQLADEGIESFIQDENMVSLTPFLTNAVGGIKLLVFEQDVARAREVLALNEFNSLGNAFKGKIEAQATCPRCGSIEVVQRKSLFGGILFLILFSMPLAAPTKKYFCASCGHKWKSS